MGGGAGVGAQVQLLHAAHGWWCVRLGYVGVGVEVEVCVLFGFIYPPPPPPAPYFPGLKNLTELELQGCENITGGGLAHLADHLSTLQVGQGWAGGAGL